jgi:hypothetical protein
LMDSNALFRRADSFFVIMHIDSFITHNPT